MSEPQIMTLEEVAEYLRVSERTVYDWANKGEIPCGKLGTSWRFKRSEVERWVDRKLSASQKSHHDETVALHQVLRPDRVHQLACGSKQWLLNALIDSVAELPEVTNRTELAREVFEREELMSTGIGFGIGVPHVRLASVTDLVMAVGVNSHALEDYASLDGSPVRIVCLLAARDDQHTKYLKTLAAISGLMKDEAVRNRLLDAPDEQTIFETLTEDT